MKEKTKPIVNTFTARLSAVTVSLLYTFMIKRISKGYSTAELSFLMGYSIDYIRQKEELKTIGFSFENLHAFNHALEEHSLKSFTNNFETDNRESEYRLVKTISESKIDIRMFKLESDLKETLIFHIMEENPDRAKQSGSEAENLIEANAILNVLFNGRLFYTPQNSLDIYKRCRSVSGSNSLSPKHVQAALFEMTKKKTFPRLKRIRSKDYGCMYEKIFE